MAKLENIPTGKLVNCRAQVHPLCRNGHDEWEGAEMNRDGTWDGESIVCDYCYVMLMDLSPSGRALSHEIPQAIEDAHAANAKRRKRI